MGSEMCIRDRFFLISQQKMPAARLVDETLAHGVMFYSDWYGEEKLRALTGLKDTMAARLAKETNDDPAAAAFCARLYWSDPR